MSDYVKEYGNYGIFVNNVEAEAYEIWNTQFNILEGRVAMYSDALRGLLELDKREKEALHALDGVEVIPADNVASIH
jgi:hypothetical protein